MDRTQDGDNKTPRPPRTSVHQHHRPPNIQNDEYQNSPAGSSSSRAYQNQSARNDVPSLPSSRQHLPIRQPFASTPVERNDRQANDDGSDSDIEIIFQRTAEITCTGYVLAKEASQQQQKLENDHDVRNDEEVQPTTSKMTRRKKPKRYEQKKSKWYKKKAANRNGDSKAPRTGIKSKPKRKWAFTPPPRTPPPQSPTPPLPEKRARKDINYKEGSDDD